VERDLYIPPEHEVGVPAEVLSAAGAEHGFVLDFGTSVEERYVATARVRVPTTAILDVREALDQAIRGYELDFGEIHRPRRRGV
jgi:hypothetical protein